LASEQRLLGSLGATFGASCGTAGDT